mgnify:CR=1 FL=1
MYFHPILQTQVKEWADMRSNYFTMITKETQTLSTSLLILLITNVQISTSPASKSTCKGHRTSGIIMPCLKL